MTNRLMTKAEAAEFCRLTPAAFSDWVRKKRLPGPIAGTRRWDKVAIERAIDRLSGIELPGTSEPKSSLAAWRETYERNRAQKRQGGP